MRKLYIERFGPVKKAELELRDINLFIGEQSIGKSTLAKLITILTDHLSLCKLTFLALSGWNEQLKAYNLDMYSKDDYLIHYEMEENEVKFFFDIRPKKLSSFMRKKGKRITNKNAMVSEIVASKPFFHSTTLYDYFSQEKNVKEKETTLSPLSFLSNSIYIPAERIIYSVITNLLPAFTLVHSVVPLNLLRFMVDLENAKKEYSQLEMTLLNTSYIHEGTEDFFYVKEKGEKYPLSVASSGIQSTFPLLLVLHYAINNREYSSFVIEEPESNLFPQKQVELLKHIIKKVKSEKRTLTITTHSPYLLSAMNNYLFAGTLVDRYGSQIRDSISKILPEPYQLKPGDCSVYSLGEKTNGEGCYCKSLIDEETGMIDFNALDGETIEMTAEFDQLQEAFIQMKK